MGMSEDETFMIKWMSWLKL